MARSATADRAIAVVGGGPTGLAAALALHGTGVGVIAITGATTGSHQPDRRTFALFPSSVRFLQAIGAAAALDGAQPLDGIRLVDDMGQLWRAPEVSFRAAELGLDGFGFNVAHTSLVAALQARVAATPGISQLAASVSSVAPTDSAIRLTLDNGQVVEASLVVGADGARSLCRRAAGIETREWAYDQTAVVTRFRHSREHGGLSTELHRPAGPCTVVPLPGRESALVWVERPAAADRIMGLSDEDFAMALEQRLMGLLGAVSDPDPRQSFPLRGLRAVETGASRIALVGEAAHVFPPIGAQGLNLGLRDVAALADVVARHKEIGGDIGGADAMTAYSKSRASDISGRTFAVDLLDRSLLSTLPGIHLVRGFGLHAINAIAPFRQAAMRAGLGPAELPSLMRQA